MQTLTQSLCQGSSVPIQPCLSHCEGHTLESYCILCVCETKPNRQFLSEFLSARHNESRLCLFKQIYFLCKQCVAAQITQYNIYKYIMSVGDMGSLFTMYFVPVQRKVNIIAQG